MSTEDMPSQVATNVSLNIKKMNSSYAELCEHFIDDLSLENDKEIVDDTLNELSDDFKISSELDTPPPFQEDSNEEN